MQKALPQRGYHQVRQRWLRRLRAYPTDECRAWISLPFAGTMENNKSVEAGPNPTGGPANGQTINSNGTNPDPSTIPIPKLGMAPLSSELAIAAASNNNPAEIVHPSNRPPPDPLQPTDPHDMRTPIPPTVDSSGSNLAPIDNTAVPTTLVPPEPKQAPQTSEPLSSLPETTAPLSDPTPTVGPEEQPRPPDPDPTPEDLPSADKPINADSHPPSVDGTPKK